MVLLLKRYDIVWDQTNNRFALLDGEKLVYGEESYNKAKEISYNIWKFADNKVEAENGKYSVYLTEEFAKTEVASLTVNTGLDAGKYDRLTKVEYINNGDGKEVVIRTNTANTELIVNAPSDTVKHYDAVGMVHVINVDANNCYEENGAAAFTQVDAGKYKTTANADVELLFVTSEEVKVEVVAGTVVHAHTTSEDAAASLNGNSKGVYFDYDGENATEQGGKDHSTPASSLNLSETYDENKTKPAVIQAVAEAESSEEENKLACYIGAAGFETLEDARDAIKADVNANKTIKLNKNLIVSYTSTFFTISVNQNITLDLNGYNLLARCTLGAASQFILNKGTLNLIDSKDINNDGNAGMLAIVSENSWIWSGIDGDYAGSYASNLIRNEGTLTINNGYYLNNIVGSAAYVVDNYGAGSVKIEGGKLETARASAIRMFYNNGGKLTINDGIIGGASSFMGVQVMGTSTNGVNVTLTGGTYFGTYSVYAGYGSNDENYWNTSSFTITGGTYDSIVQFTSTFKNVSITGGTFPSKVTMFWGYVYVDENGDVYYEADDGSNAGKVEEPWDKKSYWEEQGYIFEYDSKYNDYAVSYEVSIAELIGDYLDDNHELVDNGNGTSSVK